MRKNKFRVLIFLLILIFAFSMGLSAAEFSSELFDELADAVNEEPTIEVPDYSVLELDNGMIIYLAEDHELPIVEMSAYLRGGINKEHKKESGISSLMTELMNLGSENYSETEMGKFKEINGLSFSFSSDFDKYRISGNSLSTEKEELISLTAEILKNPNFERDYFSRTVNENIQYYKQQFYEDDSLLDMYFYKNLYGDHPYGYQFNYNLAVDFLNDVKPEDLYTFYRKNINPSEMIMALSGDFETDSMKELIKTNFSDWKNKEISDKGSYVNVNPKNHGRIILVNKSDATQAKIRMGYNFYTYNYPKKVPFLMGNMIFGSGGFNSRLMENLRTEKGYVYGTNSRTEYHKYGGSYYINLSVEPEKSLKAVQAVEEEMNLIKSGKNPIKEKELFENVNLYNAVFPKAYKEQIEVLDKLMYEIEFRSNTEQYINKLIEEYNGLTAEEVQNVFSEELYPEIVLTVIVGPKDRILPIFREKNIEVEVIE